MNVGGTNGAARCDELDAFPFVSVGGGGCDDGSLGWLHGGKWYQKRVKAWKNGEWVVGLAFRWVFGDGGVARR